MVQQAEPMLRSERFLTAFNVFEQTMGLDLLSPELRADVVANRRVDRELVLGYWEEVLRSDPIELQRRIDRQAASVTVPCLAVFGHDLSPTSITT